MATPRTKVKVLRIDLIAQIEEKYAEQVAKYEADLAKWEAERDDFPNRVLAWAEQVAKYEADLAKWGKLVQSTDQAYRSGGYRYFLKNVPAQPQLRGKPTKPREPRSLKQLKMGVDETLTVSVDAVEDYLNF